MTAAQKKSPELSSPLVQLIDLTRRARHAATAAELRFLLVNDTYGLTPFRQSALWFSGAGVQAMSGVVLVEANAPYAIWLDKVVAHCASTMKAHGPVAVDALPAELAAQWQDWLPAQAYWLPLSGAAAAVATGGEAKDAAGGLIVARDLPWTPQEGLMLAEWLDAWGHAWQALHRSAWVGWRQWWNRLRHPFAARVKPAAAGPALPWWKRRALHWALALLVVALFPVRLTVLAPGELVPQRPEVVRAPLDGVVDVFHVQPNDRVTQGQPLFGFDEAIIRSKLDVARQSLATAEAEYRQSLQQALNDPKSKAMLAVLAGKIEEKRADLAYVEEQLGRAQVLASRDGVALFDDPSEWIGRPVTIGERIMRIAAPEDIEVEAWVAMADAIPLAADAEVALYLHASPLSPVKARLRYLSHEAVERPDGSYAYRLRAKLLGQTAHRVGLKGTARIDGRRVPLIYWVLRRPWAGVRGALGW